MRSSLLRTGVALALAVGTFAGPLGAAANASTIIAQAAQGKGTLGGVVVDAAGRPVAGATVSVAGSTTVTLTTDANGTFSTLVTPGLYTVVVSRGGFRTSETDDVAVTTGSSASLRVGLQEQNLQTLSTIGRVTTTARQSLNLNTSAVTTLPATIEAERVLPRLNELVAELPGVTIQRGNLSPNADFVIRGGLREARTFIDGHPVSSGNFGAYNTGYTSPFAFGNVEITRGPGFFGPNGAETVFGTANLVTPGFTARRTFNVQGGVDSYNGSFENLLYRDSIANGRLQVAFGKSFIGTRDANDGSLVYRLNGNVNPATTVVAGQTPITFLSTQPVDLIADASNRQWSAHELGKLRYNFNETTSLTGEFLGLHGGITNQGGNYGGFIPNYTPPTCTTTNRATTCDVAAAYNAPYIAPLIGSPIPVLVGGGLGSVKDNEQIYGLEFRTSFKNDTLIVRPYAANIQRLIQGGLEQQLAGYAGILGSNYVYGPANSWYVVSNPATQCTGNYQSAVPAVVTNNAITVPAIAATGACVKAVGNNGLSAPLVGSAATAACPTLPASSIPATSLVGACYIAGRVKNNSGQFVYGPDFNQNETDTLHGVTFTYTHPFGDNNITVGYDYNTDNSNFISGDFAPYAQPVTFASTNLGQIPTLFRKNTVSVGGTFRVAPALTLTAGGYFFNWHNNTYAVDPALVNSLVAQLSTNPQAFNGANFVLTPFSQTFSHFDPRVGVTFRPGPNDVIRASVGSAVTVPYPGFAGQVPGLRAPSGQTQPQASNYVLSLYNPNLKPQTTTAYDLGFDHRLADGGVLSFDAFNNTLYNAFAGSTVASLIPPPQPNPNNYGVYQNVNINAGQIANYGIELSLNKTTGLGWGYRFSTTLQRNYYYDVDPSLLIYSQNQIVPYKQIDTTPKIPYSKAYAELRWAGLKQTLVTFGADYTGPNNQTNAPGAFTVFNSTVRFPIGGFTAQLAGDNIFNYSTAIQGYGGLYDAGNYTLTYGNPVAGTVSNNYAYGRNSFPNNILRVLPRTIRFSISRDF